MARHIPTPSMQDLPMSYLTQHTSPLFKYQDQCFSLKRFSLDFITAQWLDFQPQQVKKNSFYPSVIRYPIQLKALKLTQHPRLSTTTIHFIHTIITTYRSYTHQHRITAQRVTHTRLAPCSIDCFWCFFRFISHFSSISQQFVSLSIQHMNALLRLTFNNNLIFFFSPLTLFSYHLNLLSCPISIHGVNIYSHNLLILHTVSILVYSTYPQMFRSSRVSHPLLFSLLCFPRSEISFRFISFFQNSIIIFLFSLLARLSHRFLDPVNIVLSCF